jgi:hypothetical protein
MLTLLLVSFGTSIASLVAESAQEKAQKRLDEAKANEQILDQRRQIAALRKIALDRHFAGAVVRLEFSPGAFQTILKKYPAVEKHLNDELIFVAKEDVVRYTPQAQDTIPLADYEAGPSEELYRQFKAFILALCSTNFSMMLGNGTEVPEITPAEWPPKIEVEENTVVLEIRPRELTLRGAG